MRPFRDPHVSERDCAYEISPHCNHRIIRKTRVEKVALEQKFLQVRVEGDT